MSRRKNNRSRQASDDDDFLEQNSSEQKKRGAIMDFIKEQVLTKEEFSILKKTADSLEYPPDIERLSDSITRSVGQTEVIFWKYVELAGIQKLLDMRDQKDEPETLRESINLLRKEIKEQKKQNEKHASQMQEFLQLFEFQVDRYKRTLPVPF